MRSFTLLSLAMGASASIPAGVPSYAVDYAPMVYLYTGETYFPSDLGAQLTNTQPEVNFTLVSGAPNPLTLNNLDQLNSYGGKSVYLSSKQDPATNPSWLNGVVPDSVGKTNGAVSCGIIINDHGAGLVDVFYMYFYAFNYGGFYFGQDVDLHVGDWEHNMVRFMNGKPTGLWYSQHSNGEAFTYDATEKYNGGLRVSQVVFGWATLTFQSLWHTAAMVRTQSMQHLALTIIPFLTSTFLLVPSRTTATRATSGIQPYQHTTPSMTPTPRPFPHMMTGEYPHNKVAHPDIS